MQLVKGLRAEATGCGRVACGEAVELVDGRIALGLVIDHGDPVPGPRQHERCREPSRPTTDDQHVAADGVACSAVHDADTWAGVVSSTAGMCGW